MILFTYIDTIIKNIYFITKDLVTKDNKLVTLYFYDKNKSSHFSREIPS